MFGNRNQNQAGGNTQTVFINFNSKKDEPIFIGQVKVDDQKVMVEDSMVTGYMRSIKLTQDIYQGKPLQKCTISLEEDNVPKIGATDEKCRQVYIVSFSMNLMSLKMFNRLYRLVHDYKDQAPKISFSISKMMKKDSNGKYTIPVMNKEKQMHQINVFVIDGEGKYTPIKEYFSTDPQYGVVSEEFNKMNDQCKELESSKPREKFWTQRFSEMGELAFSMFNAYLAPKGKIAIMKEDGSGYNIQDIDGSSVSEDTTEDVSSDETEGGDLPF